jgi:multicomponent Na+:H+ antiporter subunit G
MAKEIIALFLITIGLLFTAFGIFGLFRFKIFYMRILASANSDTVGMLFMLTGAMVYAPSTTFALKILLIIILSLFTTPLSSHATARSAYASGFRVKK